MGGVREPAGHRIPVQEYECFYIVKYNLWGGEEAWTYRARLWKWRSLYEPLPVSVAVTGALGGYM